MGGKTSTSTQQVSIPPEVLARYTEVNKRAEEAAKQPFQAYGGEFVAPLTETQQAGIGQVQKYSEAAQPYYQTAAGMAQSGARDVGRLTASDIEQYKNPYIQSVVDPMVAALRQQQGQQMSALVNPQTLGAFGGDRSGLVAANLAREQLLGTQQAISPLYFQAYNQAVQTAQGQQAVEAQNRARELQAAQEVSGIGAGAQTAGLQGGQAVVGAGTLGQQTEQARRTAEYQQFLQERGYPFQIAQFLAGIAMGTGAQSGSTTTTTQPAPFLSDERLKDNIEEVGRLHDGQKIYRYDMGDGRTQVGLLAQEVAGHKPEAIGVHPSGYLMVDYRGATDDAADLGKGVIPSSMGGAVYESGNYADGGSVGLGGLESILAAQRGFFNPQQGGAGGGLGGAGYIPAGLSVQAKPLQTAGSLPKPEQSGFQQVMGAAKEAQSLYDMGESASKGFDKLKAKIAPASIPQAEWQQKYEVDDSSVPLPVPRPENLASGGRAGYALGGNPYTLNEDPLQEAIDENEKLRPQQMQKPGPLGPVQPGLGGQLLDMGSKAAGLVGLGNMAMGAPAALGSAAGSIGAGLEAASAFLPFLSDRRVKHDVQEVGKLHDGTPVYRFKYNGDGRTQIGLMAQDVEKRTPDAVGIAGGYKTVDYERATDPSLRKNKMNGGAADRKGYADGSEVYGPTFQDQPIMTPAESEEYIRQGSVKRGINPNFATNVFRGESALRHQAVGDEGSSFGPAQLHYGNISKTYPNPGLGDVFTEQTGIDLRDPEVRARTQRQQIDFALDQVKKKGWNDWSVAKKLMQGSEPASDNLAQQPRQPGVGGLDYAANKYMAPASTGVPAEIPEQGGLGGLATSSKFWIPLLTGIGTMASSPSRYLGSAILQGLGGGAQAYANLEEQQAKRLAEQQKIGLMTQKQNVEFANQLRQINATRQIAGLPPISMSDLVSGKNIAFEAPKAPVTGPTGVIPPAPSAEGTATGPMAAPSGMAGAVAGPAGTGTEPSGISAGPSGPVEAAKAIVAEAPAAAAPPTAGFSTEDLSFLKNVHPSNNPILMLQSAQKLNAEAETYKKNANIQMSSGNEKAAEYWSSRADSVMKQALDITRSINDMAAKPLTMKDGSLAYLPSSLANMAAKRATETEAETRARQGAEVKEAYDEEGNKIFVPGDVIQKAARNGSAIADGKMIFAGPSPYLKPAVDSYERFNNDAISFESDYQINRQKIVELNHIYQAWQAGRGSQALADLAGYMKKYGIPISPSLEKGAAGFDAAYKGAVDQAFKTLESSGAVKAPATGLREALATSARPDADPAALYKIQTDKLAALDYSHDLYNQFLSGKEKNIGKVVSNFSEKNKFSDYVDRARQEVSPFAGTTQESLGVTVGGEKPALPAPPPDPTKRVVGQTYTTPRGEFVWSPEGWRPVQSKVQ